MFNYLTWFFCNFKWIMPLVLVITLPAIIKANLARYFGDKTADSLGLLSYNPLHYFDFMGSFVFPVIFWKLFSVILGWPVTVPVSKKMLSDIKHSFIISGLVILSNLIFAAISLTVLHYCFIFNIYLPETILVIFDNFIDMNISYFILQMIPIFPFEGSNLAELFLPKRLKVLYNKIGIWGVTLLIYLIYYHYFDFINLYIPCIKDNLKIFLINWIWI